MASAEALPFWAQVFMGGFQEWRSQMVWRLDHAKAL